MKYRDLWDGTTFGEGEEIVVEMGAYRTKVWGVLE
jgi:hypothetical protein